VIAARRNIARARRDSSGRGGGACVVEGVSSASRFICACAASTARRHVRFDDRSGESDVCADVSPLCDVEASCIAPENVRTRRTAGERAAKYMSMRRNAFE